MREVEIPCGSSGLENTGRSLISFAEKQKVCDFFGVGPIKNWRVNPRGLVNLSLELDNLYFLTVLTGRTATEVDCVATIANGIRKSVPLIKPLIGQTGYSLGLKDGPALLSERQKGVHYIGSTHTEKYPIPEVLHRSLADVFWELQGELSAAPGHLKAALSRPSRATIGAFPEVMPDFTKTLEKYSPTEESTKFFYPDLVHDDLERQNILSQADKITGIVDLDSIRSGDILYEFSHFLFNNVFCDPEADFSTADLYIDALLRAGVVNPKHISTIYGYIYRFAISDIVDFEDLNQNSPTDSKVVRIPLLVAQYDLALKFASSFFQQRLPEKAA